MEHMSLSDTKAKSGCCQELPFIYQIETITTFPKTDIVLSLFCAPKIAYSVHAHTMKRALVEW